MCLSTFGMNTWLAVHKGTSTTCHETTSKTTLQSTASLSLKVHGKGYSQNPNPGGEPGCPLTEHVMYEMSPIALCPRTGPSTIKPPHVAPLPKSGTHGRQAGCQEQRTANKRAYRSGTTRTKRDRSPM